MMNLTSVKYQDSCIYIGLIGPREHGNGERFLEEVKNLYAVYKIKAYESYVRDTILVRKKDISSVRGEIIVKFELNQLHRPEECEIEIVSLKFILRSGKREELALNRSYPLLDIRARSPISTKKQCLNKKVRIENKSESSKKTLFVKQEVTFSSLEPPKKEESIAIKNQEKTILDVDRVDRVDRVNSTIIERTTPVSTIVSKVEANVERKLDAQTKRLEMDITQLCYGTIDLLLTSLPQPGLAEEYRSSSAMVQSIHRYINSDLLQKKEGEGELT
jgi:hypothetical protein